MILIINYAIQERSGRLRKSWCSLVLMAVVLSCSAQSEESTFSLEDHLGRVVDLKGPADRVITIPMPAGPMLIGLEQGVDSLLAMHPESRSAIQAGLLGTLFPEGLKLPTDVVGRGFMPNVEAILRLSPDLVIQYGNRGEDLVRPLQAAGLNVAAIQYDGSEEDVRAWLRLFGVAVGSQEQANRLIKLRNEVQSQLASLRKIPQERKAKVLYLFRALSGFQVAGSGTFNDYSINLAGGRNVAAELAGFKPVNKEQILRWNPDVILLNSFEPGLSPEIIAKDTLLNLTNAAKTERVHLMPIGGYRWDPPSHESPLSWLWLAEQFHSISQDIDMEEEVTRIVDTLYGPFVTDEVLSMVLAHFDVQEKNSIGRTSR